VPPEARASSGNSCYVSPAKRVYPHTPGHCAGQVALLWRPGRMLFAGDVCMNIMGLGDTVGTLRGSWLFHLFADSARAFASASAGSRPVTSLYQAG